MRRLPLYEHPPVHAVEAEEPADLDSSCKLCPLHANARTVCLPAEGEPGGLLVVGEGPGRTEDDAGRPFVGASGKRLRAFLARMWRGPVAIDNAVRCFPGNTELTEKHISACRRYLAGTVDEVRPTRILALGAQAAKAVLGRSVAPFSARRGYGYLLAGRFGPRPIPVFTLIHPAAGLRNRFVNAWLESDLEWALSATPALPPLDSVARLVETEADALEAELELTGGPTSFDIESAGLMYHPSFRLLCLSATRRGNTNPWIWDRAALADPARRAPLARYLGAAAQKLGANVKFDENGTAWALGLRTRGVRGDVRLWRKLLEPEADARLAAMVELIGMGGMKEESELEEAQFVARARKGAEVERRQAKQQAEATVAAARGLPVRKPPKLTAKSADGLSYLTALDERDHELAALVRDQSVDYEAWAKAVIPEPILLRYNARDTVGASLLADHLEQRLAELPEIDTIRRCVVEPAARAIARVERWGVPAERPAIEHFASYLDARMVPIAAQIKAEAGPDFNASSPDQIVDLLFGKLKLPVTKLTKGGKPSTDEAVLEQLAPQHPVCAALVEHRHLTKLQGTYARGMLRHLRPDGRIHTGILLDGATTGRTSSSDPNMQNIPRPDSTEGKMARDCFAARPGWVLIQLDYGQIEYRVAALLSGDPEMIKIFNSGVDYHLGTARLISQDAWGIPPEAVGKAQRSLAKNVNFGILYGKTASTFAKEWGVTIGRAQAIIDMIMGKFTRLAVWVKEQLAEVRRTGYSWTWWNGQRARRRSLHRIADPEDGSRVNAENSTVNTPTQGTASEFLVASIGAVVPWIEEEGLDDRVELVLPVHDSLMFHVRTDMADLVIREARRIMTSWNSGPVPLQVDAEMGPAWGSLVSVPG